ncbi:MAG: tetratricopeptide repeat protein [Verrucomicrobia bacterium]|nr:tetratricopeptide repeat protein [Verrucomicrobiota bacterium]
MTQTQKNMFSPKGLTKKVALAIVVPLVLLAGLEIVLRLADYGYPTRFLIPQDVGGQTRYVDNQFFGYRVFPEKMTRLPAPILLTKAKPENTVRIVVLGESAAMGEPLPEFGLPRQLQVLLSKREPEKSFEVINAAMTAINSHVIREIAQDVAELDPDYFVLMIGNNEVVGPFGPGTILNSFTENSAVIRLRLLLSRLRLTQLLRNVLPFSRTADTEDERWAGMEMFLDRQIARDDPAMPRVYERFAHNLKSIIGTAEKSGAEVVLCTIPVNLYDLPPLASLSDAGLSEAESTQWKKLFLEGIASQSVKLYAEAIGLFVTAAGIDPGYAELQYRLGQCMQAIGDHEVAEQYFHRACDLDSLRFRADSKINRIIRDTAASEEVTLVDAARLLVPYKNVATREEQFLDHVHLSFGGNYELSKLIADRVVATKGEEIVSLDQLSEELLFTPWNTLELVDAMLSRRSRPPFTNVPGNREQLQMLESVRKTGVQMVDKLNPEEMIAKHDKAIASYPDDWYYPLQIGRILIDLGHPAPAGPYLTSALEMLPHRYDVRGDVARVEALLGRPESGLSTVLGDGRHGHFAAEILHKCATSLGAKGKQSEAFLFLEKAVELSGHDATMTLELAGRYAAAKRPEDAERLFLSVIDRSPDMALAAEEYGIFLALQDRWSESDALFAKTIAAHPDRPETRLKYAIALFQHGDIEKSRDTLRALVEDHPSFTPAQYYLERIASRIDAKR